MMPKRKLFNQDFSVCGVQILYSQAKFLHGFRIKELKQKKAFCCIHYNQDLCIFPRGASNFCRKAFTQPQQFNSTKSDVQSKLTFGKNMTQFLLNTLHYGSFHIKMTSWILNLKKSEGLDLLGRSNLLSVNDVL